MFRHHIWVLLVVIWASKQVAFGRAGFLDTRLAWDGANREKIELYINNNKNKNKIVVFDWDNTVIKNDIGDATTFYMLMKNKIIKPKSWQHSSKHLGQRAGASLVAHCPLHKTKGKFLLTHENKECATAILCIYYQGKIWDGKKHPAPSSVRCSGAAAFRLLPKANTDTIEPSYAWTVALQAGHTPAAVRDVGLIGLYLVLKIRQSNCKNLVLYLSQLGTLIPTFFS